MADAVERHSDLTKALETATRLREDADTRWRAAIAEALAAGVPRDVILQVAGGWDATEVRGILRQLDQRNRTFCPKKDQWPLRGGHSDDAEAGC